MLVLKKRKVLANLSVGPERREDGLVVRALKIDKRGLQPLVFRGDARHVPEGAAVHIVDANDVRVGPERLEDCRGRCRARGERKGVRAARLNGREGRLEGIAVRVAGAGVFEALQPRA